MKKSNKNKNSIKLRLVPSSNNSNSSDSKWALVSERDFTDKEKQKIKNIVGNVIFPDEIEESFFEESFNTLNNTSSKDNGSTKSHLEEDIYRDCYFPDDGYDYEQHLYTINKKKNKPRSSLIENHSGNEIITFLNSTTTLNDCENVYRSSEIIDELHEIMNCFEEPEEFEELNDDFILNATGVNDIKEIDKSIDINKILWGGNNKSIQSDLEFIDCPHLNISQNFEKSTEFINDFEVCADNEECDELFDKIMQEYDDSSSSSEKDFLNFSEDKTSKRSNLSLNNNLDIMNYEHILDKYIREAKNNFIETVKDEKKMVEIGKPLETSEIEKVVSIIEKINIDETSSATTQLSETDTENEESHQKNFVKSSDIRNRPQKLDLSMFYIKAKQTQKNHTFNPNNKEYPNYQNYLNKDESNIYLDACHLERRRNETSDERRERKNAIKQARREIREIKRKNKLDTKELKNKLAGSLLSKNPHDIKSGVRYYKF